MIPSLKHRTYIFTSLSAATPSLATTERTTPRPECLGSDSVTWQPNLEGVPHPEDSMWLPKSLSRARFTAKILWNGWKLHIKLLDMLDIVVCLVFLRWSFFVSVGPFQLTSISLVKTCPSLHPANPLTPDESMDTLSCQVNLTSQRLETATQTLSWIERVQRGPSRQYGRRLKITRIRSRGHTWWTQVKPIVNRFIYLVLAKVVVEL